MFSVLEVERAGARAVKYTGSKLNGRADFDKSLVVFLTVYTYTYVAHIIQRRVINESPAQPYSTPFDVRTPVTPGCTYNVAIASTSHSPRSSFFLPPPPLLLVMVIVSF